MDIFIEVMTVFWQAFCGFLSVIGSTIWENLPMLLEIKKIMGYFTPVGMVALYLGVPTIIVTATIWLIKKAVKSI